MSTKQWTVVAKDDYGPKRFAVGYGEEIFLSVDNDGDYVFRTVPQWGLLLDEVASGRSAQDLLFMDGEHSLGVRHLVREGYEWPRSYIGKRRLISIARYRVSDFSDEIR